MICNKCKPNAINAFEPAKAVTLGVPFGVVYDTRKHDETKSFRFVILNLEHFIKNSRYFTTCTVYWYKTT